MAGAQEFLHELQVILNRVCTEKNIVNVSFDDRSTLQCVLQGCLSLHALQIPLHELLERGRGVCQAKGHNPPFGNLAVRSDKRRHVLGPVCQLDLPEPVSLSSLTLHGHAEALSSALSRLGKVPECLLVSLLNLP